MKPLSEHDADSILEEGLFADIFSIVDPIERTGQIIKHTQRAKELGVKTYFDDMVKAYKQVERDMSRAAKEKSSVCTLDNYTNFDGPYDNMFCGGWIANETGIYSQRSAQVEEIACYHPIVPVERLKNLETGEEQIKIAYKRNNHWNEFVVPKTMVTSANKIVALSGKGVSVTSENAKLLVKYLADVENSNDDYINVQYSTSKLGWHGEEFIPYDKAIVFDGEARFRQLFESIQEKGHYNMWQAHIRELRASGRMEIKFLLAASFASVLVKPLNALPFFVDLWGETEGGKTVTEMVAASVWGNPDENQFIGDFKATDVALEARADMLNNLPMILDDTSRVNAKIRDNFEGFVYDLCSGKGKTRSNKELGVNRENRWKNVIISNGERPLNSYVSQGGAINRILEVKCEEKVYQDPSKTADAVKKNYGFAGKEFVELIKKLGFSHIRTMQKDIQKDLSSDDKMQKQAMALSVVLTADKLITDYIFKDGQYISLEDARTVLIDRNELSDNERCYNYIIDKVGMNSQRFDIRATCEQWGTKEDGYAIFYVQAFDQLCKDGGFSKKSFLDWADKKKLIQTQAGRMTKVKKIDGSAARCIWIKLNPDMDDHGFTEVDEQEKLPFK